METVWQSDRFFKRVAHGLKAQAMRQTVGHHRKKNTDDGIKDSGDRPNTRGISQIRPSFRQCIDDVTEENWFE